MRRPQQASRIASACAQIDHVVIRLDARARGEVLPFAAVQAPLMVAQEKAAWLRASRAFIASLVAAAEVSGITLKAA